MASYLAAGRILVPYAGEYRAEIESSLSEALGAQINIGSLEGTWRLFSPVVSIQELSITPPESSSRPLTIQQLDFGLDVPRSIFHRKWVISEVLVQGVSVDFIEDENGRWGIRGLVMGQNNYDDQLVDLLLNTRNLIIDNSSILLRRSDNQQLNLNPIELRLKNRGELHQLHVRGIFEGQVEPVDIMLDLEGDPRVDYGAELYLGFEQANLLPLLNFAKLGLPVEPTLTEGSAQVWLRKVRHGVPVMHGNFQYVNIEVQDPSSGMNYEVNDFQGKFSALRPMNGHWQLWGEELGFNFNENTWKPESLFLEYSESASPTVLFQAASLDLEVMAGLAKLSDILPAEAISILNDLSPTGELLNTRLELTVDENSPMDYALNTTLQDVGVQAWNGAPSGQGLNGSVELSGQGRVLNGMAEVESNDFSIFLPRVFSNGWQYDEISSKVYWSSTEDLLRIHSNVMDITNEQLTGNVQFELLNTRRLDGEWKSDLSLFVGVESLNGEYKSQYLPTLAGIQPTMRWLDQSIISAEIRDSAFIYRGSTKRGAAAATQSVLGFFNLSDGHLQFLPEWPAIEHIDGYVELRNQEVDIHSPSAEIAGIELRQMEARVRPQSAGSWLTVTGNGQSVTEFGLDFLRNTPAGDGLGDNLDTWQGSGELDIALQLGIPLNASDPREDEIRIEVQTLNSSLNMVDLGLEFEQLNGVVNYHSESGLNAEALQASLFDSPVEALISTQESTLLSEGPEQVTQISLFGRASQTAIQDWTLQSDFVREILNFAEGEIEYQAEFSILSSKQDAAETVNDLSSRLHIQTDLQGLSLEMPSPMEKSISEVESFDVIVNFFPDVQVIELRYDEVFSGHLLFQQEQFVNGRFSLGQTANPEDLGQLFNPEELTGEGLVVLGDLDYLDYDEWSEIYETIQKGLSASRGGDSEGQTTSLISLVALEFDQLVIYKQPLDQVFARVQPLGQEGWDIFLENTLVSGNLAIPEDDVSPWQVNLNYLRLPEGDDKQGEVDGSGNEEVVEQSEEEDYLVDVDPAILPRLNFSTEEFSVGESNLGSWAFSLEPVEDGVVITDFQAIMEDARIIGLGGEGGASLDWQFRQNLHTTHFSGLFDAGNLATVLPPLGLDALVESTEASFTGQLLWRGSPANFSLMKSVGTVDVSIEDGRFVDIDSGSARLLGAFNLDSLVRRLQLDFSDLYQSGLAYDSISGMLRFDEGIVDTDTPFVVDGPSSKITLNGQINLIEETIDAEMVVNVPLGQNLTVLAGLLGAWPLAVSTYVASHLFEDEVEGMTAVLYRLEGPWNELQTGFSPAENAETESTTVEGMSASNE